MAGIPLGSPEDPLVAKALSLIGGDDTKVGHMNLCMPDGMEFDSSLGGFVTKGGYKTIIDLKQ